MRLPLLLTLATAVLLTGCAAWVSTAEPRVQHTVLEDSAVKIDELRVRGQVQRLQVAPKAASAPAYEILPEHRNGGPTASGAHDGAGQRGWTLLSF